MKAVRAAAIAVSDPTSSSYGSFLSQTMIDDMTKPLPDHAESVKTWLKKEADCHLESPATAILFHVACTSVLAAERLLRTRFRRLRNVLTQQTVMRAGNYQVPVGVKTVFGLHGLPIQHAGETKASTTTHTQARNVTPAVILDTYNAENQVKVASNTTNKQAVVSFGASVMSITDLAHFFALFVNESIPGVDDTVSRFVGAPGTLPSGATPEATLDIQYIMGTAKGIPTEFWRFTSPPDFCGQVHNWTSTLLAESSPPLVTSISYGWQSNLSKAGCLDTDLEAVDSDLAKMAARGLTTVVASGDWGSGSGGGQFGACNLPNDNIVATELTGEAVGAPIQASGIEGCCSHANGKAFSYSGPDPNMLCFQHHGAPGFVLNGTVLIATPVPANLPPIVPPADICCTLYNKYVSLGVVGWNYLPNPTSTSSNASSSGNCSFLSVITGNYSSSVIGIASGGGLLPVGSCTIFSSVNGSQPKVGVTSRQNLQLPLWSSWPASSPWVTSVGATRFMEETPTKEMASDQFGSGGGFSGRQKDDAVHEWQSNSVADYLALIAKSGHGRPFPPTSSFDPKARATPDVSALGEGYQIIMNGQQTTIGGTSASAPAFAALVSLLNEARIQAGKPVLGFLNPWLFGLAGRKGLCNDGMTDVVNGTNAITLHGEAEEFGWNATTGWDAATGLGTPNVGILMNC